VFFVEIRPRTFFIWKEINVKIKRIGYGKGVCVTCVFILTTYKKHTKQK